MESFQFGRRYKVVEFLLLGEFQVVVQCLPPFLVLRLGDVAAASTPTDSLVLRCLGKRGGRGHGFTSDDAKRASKTGLSRATGLSGSTKVGKSVRKAAAGFLQ